MSIVTRWVDNLTLIIFGLRPTLTRVFHLLQLCYSVILVNECYHPDMIRVTHISYYGCYATSKCTQHLHHFLYGTAGWLLRVLRYLWLLRALYTPGGSSIHINMAIYVSIHSLYIVIWYYKFRIVIHQFMCWHKKYYLVCNLTW